MRLSAKKVLWVVLFISLNFLAGYGLSHAQSQGEHKTSPGGTPASAIPNLADIIPLAAELSGRLAALENSMKGGADIAAIQKEHDWIEANLKAPSDQLKRLRDSKDYRFNRLVALRQVVQREYKSFEESSQPIRHAIRKFGARRKEWLGEEKRWHEWQASFLKEDEFDPLESTFEKANDTIYTALQLVLPELEAMLTVQERGGHTRAKINALAAELDGLILDDRRGAMIKTYRPMFSSSYFSKFQGGLWHSVKEGLDEIIWPDRRFFAQQGWIILMQGVFSIFVIIAVYRNRRRLAEPNSWPYLASRPFSAGLFLGGMSTILIYEYVGTSGIWKLVLISICAISFARLSSGVIKASWKRQSVYGLMIVLIVNRLMDVLSLPLPLSRLYMVLAALAGFFFCLRWAKESVHHKTSRLHALSLRLASLCFAVVIIAQLWGKATAALFLFSALIRSLATVLVFMLFLYMIHRGLEWLFRTAFFKRAAQLNEVDADAVTRRVARFIDVAICGLVLLPGILMIFDVYDSLGAATKGLLSLGFNLGNHHFSVGLLIVGAGILYGSFFISWILRKILMDEVFVRRRVEKGVRLSMARLVHYFIIFVGFLLALSSLGFEVSKITIILGALGVGIGFGLQGVVNNFVSGLILLFERPVRMGDMIEIGGKWSEIKRIGLRSTTVQTVDQADLIIPNADLVSNQVTNWTLTNRRVRLTVPVGVAYGSDVPLVMETLVACATDHERVSTLRPPEVLFLNFGESSLDFELRVWVTDADYRLKVISELHQEIDRRFREAEIKISFPQRDLHLRSVDESVRVGPHDMSMAKQKT